MFKLIDYSSFATDENKDSITHGATKGIFQLTSHYACIPQTPLYHLLHQRIKLVAEDIKLTMILQRNEHKGQSDILFFFFERRLFVVFRNK